ncbi:protein FAM228B [Exaiptasia diaphana]|uniref:Protein FAM228B n=1 Tax=Exaiptasia diaphana TaxID=2652724 RepID=A0A913XGI4_EXADI|nr:protein FAM228B [Exaiptasia diaphana]KXJ26157.1 Protein FAM228B [Exaiptasia diaphana]
MLKMSRRKKQGNGRISVHTPEMIDDILREGEQETIKDSGRHHRRSASAVERSRSPEYSLNKPSTSEQTFRIQNWLNEKSVRNIQERTDFESRATKNMYTTLLENEGSFVTDVDRYLDHKSLLDRRKKHLLHKKWSERVFTPIKDQIDKEMNSQNYKNLEKRKRNLYNNYLDYSNKKGVVFLDVISPEEYDPLELNANRPAPLKAVTRELDDCLISQRKNKINEDRAEIRCITGEVLKDKDIENLWLPQEPLVPLGRQGTECKTWLRMELHGIDSVVRKRSGERMLGICNDNQMSFHDMVSTKTSREIVDKELQAQKKRQFPQKHVSRIDFEWPNELPTLSTQYRPRLTSILPMGCSFDYCPEQMPLSASY